MPARSRSDAAPPRERRPVPIQDQRELCYDSLGICGKPGCENNLNIRTAATGAITTVGEMAHIIAAQDNGPRGDPEFPEDQRERYDNLILLCLACHGEVDNPRNFALYTKQAVSEWKQRLRTRRQEAIARTREEPAIGELAQLLNELATAEPEFLDSFDRVALGRKIEVNGLSPPVAATISRNIVHVPMVSKQILMVERFRPNYGEMIRVRMSAEWLAISDRGLGGDAAYAHLKDALMFNQGRVGAEGIIDIVLAYFFELCTVLHRE